MFGSSSDSSLPPLIGAGGGLVSDSVVKADKPAVLFDGKQSRDPVDLLSTCRPFPRLTTFAFRSWKVKWLLLDLDSYDGVAHATWHRPLCHYQKQQQQPSALRAAF